MKSSLFKWLFYFEILGVGLLFGQIKQGNWKEEWKYWYYRWRLLNDFMLVGDCHGCSIPANVRLPSNHSDFPNHVEWGDATIALGDYIAVLAAEYRMLDDNGEMVDSTAKELYYAMKAIERLDRYSNSIERGELTLTPGPLDGYFVRDDVPPNFVQNHKDHFNSDWVARSYPGYNNPTQVLHITDTLVKVHSDYGSRLNYVQTHPTVCSDPCSSSCTGDDSGINGLAESVDQMAGVLWGLAAVRFLVPHNATYTYTDANGNHVSYNFYDKAKELATLIVDYYIDHNREPVSPCKGDYIWDKFYKNAWADLLSDAKCTIEDAPISYYPSSINFVRIIPNLLFYFKSDPYLLPGGIKVTFIPTPTLLFFKFNRIFSPIPYSSCYPFQLPDIDYISWSSRNVGILGAGARNLCNNGPKLLPLHDKPLCKKCFWQAAMLLAMASIVNHELAYNFVFPILWVPFPPYFLAYVGIGGNVTNWVLDRFAYNADHVLFPLVHMLYHKPVDKHFLACEKSSNYYQQLLATAPCTGPYYYDTNGTIYAPSSFEWHSSHRIWHPERRAYLRDGTPFVSKCYDRSTGAFSGLDYMQLFNFYKLWRVERLGQKWDYPYAENLMYRHFPQGKNFPLPFTQFGSHSYPAWLPAFYSIEASNTINSNATVIYEAGEYIHMTDGFTVKNGATFLAHIQKHYGCDEIPTSVKGISLVNGGGPFLPIPNNTNLRLAEEPIASQIEMEETARMESSSSDSIVETPAYFLYPNPVTNHLTIRIKEGTIRTVTIKNLFGQTLFHKEVNESEVNLSTETWDAGIYLVEIVDRKGNRYTEKVIKLGS